MTGLARLDADRLWRVVQEAAAGSRTGLAGEVARLCWSGGSPRLGWVCPAPWEVVRDGIAAVREALGPSPAAVLSTGGWAFAAQAQRKGTLLSDSVVEGALPNVEAVLAVSASGSTLETRELAQKAGRVVWLRDEAAPPEAYALSPYGVRDQVAMLGAPLSMAFLVPASDHPDFEASYRRFLRRYKRIGALAVRRAAAINVDGPVQLRIVSPSWGGEGLRLWLLQLGRQVLCGKSARFRPTVDVVTVSGDESRLNSGLMDVMYAAGVFVACLALRAGIAVAEHANVRAYKELVATADPDDPAIETVTDLAGFAESWLAGRPDLRQLHVVYYGTEAPAPLPAATEIHQGSAWNHHSFHAVYADPSIAVLIIVPPEKGLLRQIAVATYRALAGRSRVVRTRAHRAVLFDVDGVLLDTGDFLDRIWSRWAETRSLDPAWVVAHTHGRRTADVLSEVAPHLDPAAERLALDDLVRANLGEVRAVAGAAHLLRTLGRTPWAIVTSGSRWFVGECFRALGLPLPTVAVYDEDVREGKPSPEGYLAAARRLGVAPAECLVIEDAPRGVAAARDAGCTVVAITTTHTPAQLSAADACLSTLADVAGLLRQEKGEP